MLRQVVKRQQPLLLAQLRCSLGLRGYATGEEQVRGRTGGRGQRSGSRGARSGLRVVSRAAGARCALSLSAATPPTSLADQLPSSLPTALPTHTHTHTSRTSSSSAAAPAATSPRSRRRSSA